MRVLRAATFNLLFLALTSLLGVLALPLLLVERRHAVRVGRIWARGVMALLRGIVGLRFVVTGQEHLPRQGPALIAAKHQSAFDTVVWLLLVPDAAYVLKRELLRVPVYGWFARHAGMIAVDRAAGAGAMRGLIRDGEAALAAGRQVVIFPEGTRTAPGSERPYQPGIAALYARAGLAVIPVATDSGRFWGRRAFLKHPGTITVAIQPPIAPGLGKQAFLSALRQRIEEPSQALLKRFADAVDKSGESGT
ncbi:MAG: 1-acyl-sn-glycerol-3-phosphate acyltransferase [Acetobacteraceae bacterium]|nr:1-acyl-sn-glycerol-3-phosphate acyltransferase [Acetobacteraceae bacterium]